jgi:hypothetical protein
LSWESEWIFVIFVILLPIDGVAIQDRVAGGNVNQLARITRRPRDTSRETVDRFV